MNEKKRVSIVTPCYNEEENIELLIDEVQRIFNDMPGYSYEHIIIDNASTDRTIELAKKRAKADPRVKIIVNVRNFGHIRSPFHGLLQASGDVAILMASDFQDPPSMIPLFLAKWEEGHKVVIGVKNKSEENHLVFFLRWCYYALLKKMSGAVEQVKNFTGFGLYDKEVLAVLRTIEDPYPYFRGLISEIGWDRTELPFTQPRRKRGKSSNNFLTLYDMAMLGFVNYSKVPLRISTFLGFLASGVAFIVALVYFVYKLFYWNQFDLGAAPLIIGLFFFSGVQLFFIGILGEYVGAIYTQVKKRALVIEKERINFRDEF